MRQWWHIDAKRDVVEQNAKRTAAFVRLHRQLGTAAKPSKKIPPQVYPQLLEVEYGKVLAGIMRTAADALKPLKGQLPKLLEDARASRGDAADHVTFAGFPIVIENHAGTVRHWASFDGSGGSTLMRYSYGYIDGAIGSDGEEVDVYIGPDEDASEVYVVDQMKAPAFTMYDEQKIMLGQPSLSAARDAYLAQYNDPRFLGSITAMSVVDFRASLVEHEGGRIEHADANEGRRARDLVDNARAKFAGALNPKKLESIAEQMGKRVADHQRGELSKQVKAALGVDIAASDERMPALIDHFAAANVALIRRIPSRLFDDVESKVSQAFTSGRRHEDLAKDIEKSEGVSENAARLIARDQISKLTSAVSRSRNQEIGLSRFRWKTVGDERVRGDPDGLYPKARPSHFLRDDKVYAYDDPPKSLDGEDEWPGTAPLCRCSDEGIFDDILDEIDTDGADEGDDEDE